MNKQNGVVYVFLVGATLFYACTGKQTQNASQLPSTTPSAIQPTLGQQIKTATPLPTSARMVVTSIPFALETPTPLPTPPDGAVTYQLKDWNEQLAFDLVTLAEQYSFADNLPMPFGEKRFNYQADQSAIKLVAQEALSRYPETNYKEKLKWRIALANTILNNPDSDEWILQEIESALNNNVVEPENLNELLNVYAFEIGDQQSAPNLFGDDQLAQVLWIVRQDRGYTGLYAALRQNEIGKYELTKIYSSWDFNFGYDEPMRIEDHTADDMPEVMLFPGYHNGSFCGYDLVIFQWMENQFVDISKNQFSFNQCDYPESWEYKNPNGSGAKSIETWRAVNLYPAVIQHNRYAWNGTQYELNESRLVPPETLDRSATEWIKYAMNEEDYRVVVDKIQQFLSNESQLQAMETELGPSYPDYLRFQLGLAYAFQSKTQQARVTLEDIQQNPQSPSTTTLSRAAQAYLENFTGDTDLYRACLAALHIMDNSLQLSERFTDDFDNHILQTWGYVPGDPTNSMAICNLNTAYKNIISNLDVNQFANLPERIKEFGVSIHSASEIDLNGDGTEEWILLTATPGDDAPVNLWVLLKTSNAIMPLPVVSWERKHFDLPSNNIDTISFSVKTTESPEGSTITLIHAGEYLYVFILDTEKPSLDHKLWGMRFVKSYAINRSDGRLEVEVTTNYDYCQNCTDTYIWVDNDFTWSDLVVFGLSEAETTLLIDSSPKKAVQQLQQINTSATENDSPHVIYLLGLAYELADEDNDAIQTYWKLWHDFPQSLYARLAWAKLEPIK